MYSDATSVELLLNGHSLGKKKTKECRAVFKMKYAPGTLTVVAYDANGKELARGELASASGEAAVRVQPETAKARMGEIVYAPVTLWGENGVVESNAGRNLTVTVTGGTLPAFGSANLCTEEQYHTGSFTTYYGRVLAVVRVNGTTTVTVTDGAAKASAQITVKG